MELKTERLVLRERRMEKVGMRYECCLRDNMFARGEFMDTLCFAVLASG